jgi:hypothetical protein
MSEENGLISHLKKLKRKTFFQRYFGFLAYTTYDDVKSFVRYLMESASCTISLSVSSLRFSFLFLVDW